MGAAPDLLRYGVDQQGVGVPVQQRAVPHHEIDDLVAVDVPLTGSGGALDVDGERLEVTDVVRDPAGEQRRRARVEGGGTLVAVQESRVDGHRWPVGEGGGIGGGRRGHGCVPPAPTGSVTVSSGGGAVFPMPGRARIRLPLASPCAPRPGPLRRGPCSCS